MQDMPFLFLSSQTSISIKKSIHKTTRGREMGATDLMLVPKNYRMLEGGSGGQCRGAVLRGETKPPPFYFLFPMISYSLIA